MIAPISSWAAAVSSTAEGLDTGISGIQLFIKAIPYNLYSLLTFVFIIALSFMQFDYGPMRAYERKARETGDLSALENAEDEAVNPKGKVIDLLLPVLVLIAVCTTGMIYVGGFFGVDAWGGTDCAGDFIGAFGNTDAFMGLPWGGKMCIRDRRCRAGRSEGSAFRWGCPTGRPPYYPPCHRQPGQRPRRECVRSGGSYPETPLQCPFWPVRLTHDG